jgi:hypothetical protein
MRTNIGILALAMLLAGCGSDTSGDGGGTIHTSGDGGGTIHTPQTYTIYNDVYGQIGAGTVGAYAVSIPLAGTLQYTITNRSTTTPDYWDVAFATPTEYSYLANGQAWQGYALSTDVSTQSNSAAVLAGDYYFVVVCRNVVEDCMFSYTVLATY